MAAYIVRVIDGHQLVGIYFARNVADLAEMVDEVFPPPDCEYRRLPQTGGIAWSGEAPIVPRKVDEGGYALESVDFDKAEGLEFTETWSSVIYDENSVRGWKRNWGGRWLTKEEIDAARNAARDSDGTIHLDPQNPSQMALLCEGRRTGYPIGHNDNTKDQSDDT